MSSKTDYFNPSNWHYGVIAALGLFATGALLTFVVERSELVNAWGAPVAGSFQENPTETMLTQKTDSDLAKELAAKAGDGPYRNTPAAISLQLAMLQAGLNRNRRHADFTATLDMQERIIITVDCELAWSPSI